MIEELDREVAIDTDSEDEMESSLGDAPEDAPATEAASTPPPPPAPKKSGQAAAEADLRKMQTREAALKSLYRHEMLALLSCVVAPLLGAYMLHAIRGQLTRPSEGLVSNFNLTIFVLGAELRPLRHMIRLIHARTLHLQRIVQAHPPPPARPAAAAGPDPTLVARLDVLAKRLDELESRVDGADYAVIKKPDTSEAGKKQHPPASARAESRRERDVLLRDLRAQVQPDLDTLARALRRSHKQQLLLAAEVEARLRAADKRADDAAVLAAAAARRGGPALFLAAASWFAGQLLSVALLPAQVMVWAVRAAWGVVAHRGATGRPGTAPAPPDKARRGARPGRVANGAAIPRVAKK